MFPGWYPVSLEGEGVYVVNWTGRIGWAAVAADSREARAFSEAAHVRRWWASPAGQRAYEGIGGTPACALLDTEGDWVSFCGWRVA